MNRVGLMLVPLLLALPLVGIQAAHADDLAVVQQAPASIGGVVVDATTLQPLSGALVNIVDTNRSALTDPQGRFSITGIEAGTTPRIRVQLIGYATATQEVELGSQNVRVALEPSAISLEGVVVSALGIEREARALGYSVATTAPDELTENRTAQVMESLTGKIAGVAITPLGTGPSGSTKVRIRGQSSIGSNNSPLIVVNGLPIDNTTFDVNSGERGSNRASDSGDGLNSINPDDIVEMTVLKGAAASALYGARAKDGVIMITTRNRAQGDGVQFEFNTNFMHEQPLDYRDYQFEYGQGEAGCRPMGFARPEGTPESGGRPCDSSQTSGVWSFGEKFRPGMTYFPFPGRDAEVPYEPQRDQITGFYRDGMTLTNTFTVSAGSERGGFSASVSNLMSEGIFPTNTFDRNTANLGFTQRIGERLNVSGNVNYANEDRRNPPNVAIQDHSTPVVMYTMANSMPLWALERYAFNADSTGEQVYSRFNNRTNPYFTLSRFENNIRDRVYGNITAAYDLLPWLTVQGRVGQDWWTRDADYNTPTGAVVMAAAPAGFVNGQYVVDMRTNREVNADFLLMADGARGDFGLNANFGGNVMRRKSETQNTLVTDFYSYGTYSLNNGRLLSPQFSISQRQVNSLYGSAEVSWREMLFLTGTARNDWFSTLSPDNRSILYPSISASFVFTDAIQAPSWLNFGKLRASYAEVGSDTDVPPYSDVLFYGINQNLLNGQYPLGSISGGTVPNPDLRPMRLSEWEVGGEFSLFDRLRLDLGYYHRIASDQIISQQISNASGFGSRRVNIGETMNQGVEALVDATLVRSEGFNWNTTVNVNYNTSEVIDLGQDLGITEIQVGTADFHGSLRQVQGMPMNQLYGRAYLRDEQGRLIHDENGVPIAGNQQIPLGDALPKWIGGITNSFDIRGVSVSALIDFKLGHKLISGTHTNAVRHGLDKSTLEGRDQGCIVGEGVNEAGEVNTVCTPIQQYYEAIRTYQVAAQSLFNAGFWQLRQITVGYDLTPYIGGRMGIEQLRVNLAANNVLLLKKWVPHIHPEQNGIYADTRMGLESTGLPITRGIGLNVNVRF